MSRRLTIEARAHASADPHTVWALLEDVNRYQDWGPWSESGYVERPPRRTDRARSGACATATAVR